jgi:hypothetical protein
MKFMTSRAALSPGSPDIQKIGHYNTREVERLARATQPKTLSYIFRYAKLINDLEYPICLVVKAFGPEGGHRMIVKSHSGHRRETGLTRRT